jgi:hypothetical protein
MIPIDAGMRGFRDNPQQLLKHEGSGQARPAGDRL